jgi:beta-lactamase regulating signal transducer with metallopeptidase domain
VSRRAGVVVSAVAATVAVGICMVVMPRPGHPAGWLLLAAIGGASFLSVLAVAIGRRAYRHADLNRKLLHRARLTTVQGIEVEELTGIEGAFVAGLVRPRIFCGQRLQLHLAPHEVKAVLLHERYHQLDRAPAKLIMLDSISPFLVATRGGRGWLARQTAALEIAADRHALAHGASRSALARAILKLQPIHAGSAGIGFATAADLRLQALLGETREDPSRSVVWLVAAVVAAAVCLTLVGLG